MAGRGRGKGKEVEQSSSHVFGNPSENKAVQVEDSVKEECLNALSHSTMEEKCSFLKSLLNVFKPGKELKVAFKLIVNAKKRESRKLKSVNKQNEETTNILPSPSSTTDEVGDKEEKPPEVSMLKSEQSVLKLDTLGGSPPAQELPVYKNFLPSQIISFDCEYVSLVQRNEFNEVVQRCGTIGIVDFFGKVIYQAKVYHEPGSFVVNYHTRKLNGFEQDSFIDGRPFSEIRNEVIDIFEKKLIVVCAGRGDFDCLNLKMGDYLPKDKEEDEEEDDDDNDLKDVFDIHQYFIKWNGTFNGKGSPTYQPIKLKFLYHHFFNDHAKKIKFQQENHDPSVDAKCTMRLFKFIYLKNPNVWNIQFDENYEVYDPFGEIKHV